MLHLGLKVVTFRVMRLLHLALIFVTFRVVVTFCVVVTFSGDTQLQFDNRDINLVNKLGILGRRKMEREDSGNSTQPNFT